MSPSGRPSGIPPTILKQMQTWRAEGESLPAIAKRLNDNGVPTPGGGREWYPQSVRQALVAADKRAAGNPTARTLTIHVEDLDEATFATMANAVWFLVAAVADQRTHWVEYSGVSAKTLNDSWQRDGDQWKRQ